MDVVCFMMQMSTSVDFVCSTTTGVHEDTSIEARFSGDEALWRPVARDSFHCALDPGTSITNKG